VKRYQTTIVAFTLSSVLSVATRSVEAQSEPEVEAGPEGFALTSADGQWQLRLRGLVQFDGRVFANDSAPDDDTEWLLRRVRPSFEGDFGERVSFRIMPDFESGTGVLVDTYVDAYISDSLKLRAGKFKPPVVLGRLQSANDLRIVERSIVTELGPNRDVGIELSGGDRVSWAVGLFNGVDDGRSGDEDEDGNQEVAARAFVEPWKGSDAGGVLGFGVGVIYGNTEGSPDTPLLSSYRSPGRNSVFSYREGADGTFADGERTRVSPQLYWYRRSGGLLGEWIRVSQDVRRTGAAFDRSDRLEHEAWDLTAEWFVTGEAAGYRDPSDAAGAVQLVARVSNLKIDDASFVGDAASFADPSVAVREAETWALGVNWFVLPGVKATVAYQRTAFEGGAVGGDRADEEVLFLRLQHRF
jgi:phosphate-selective porin OprO and OprP